MKSFTEYIKEEINEEFQPQLPVDDLLDEIIKTIPEAEGAYHIDLSFCTSHIRDILAKYEIQYKNQSGH